MASPVASALPAEPPLLPALQASSPDRSSHGSPGGLPLLDAVMGSVCAAAMGGQALPPRTLHLLQQLFPSASAISATVPSADGLGMAVVTLMQPPAPPQPRRGRGGIPAVPHHHPTAQQQLAQPLAAGGVLSFGLSTQPPAAELQLMQAFADELSSRLDGGARKKVRSRRHGRPPFAPLRRAPRPPPCCLASDPCLGLPARRSLPCRSRSIASSRIPSGFALPAHPSLPPTLRAGCPRADPAAGRRARPRRTHAA